MKRKILSLVLVIAMLASMLVVVPTVGATERATVEVTNAAGVAGDTVTVDVIVTTETMSGYQFLFEYDRTRLELVKSGDANGVMPEGNGFAGAVDSADDSDALAAWSGAVKNAKGEAVLDDEGNPIPAAFSSIFWNDTNATMHDCTAGVASATLTFKIKENATPGDAYVSIGYLANANGYEPNQIYSKSGTISAEGDIAFNPGKITVLPAGYVMGEANPSSDFTAVPWNSDPEIGMDLYYADEAEYVIITDYVGTDATVVIPETYTGVYVSPVSGEAETYTVPVLAIETGAFKNKTAVKSVVIPACVEEVRTYAFVGCSNLTDVYVLGADTELGENACGHTATLTTSGTPGTADFVLTKASRVLLLKRDGAPLTTVHGFAGSSADSMANTAGLGWDGNGLYNVSFGGVSALAPATTVAPGQMLNDGDVTVAWKNGSTVLAPGAAMTLTADTELEPVEITAPTIVNGVSLKITDDYATSAMRFTANLSVADYNVLRALGGKITMGTIITPAAYVVRAGALTKEALNTLPTQNKYIDVAATGYLTEADGVYTFAGSVRNFLKANVNVEYAAAFYLTVELADGSTFTVYSAYNHNANRSFGNAIVKAAASGAITPTQKEWIDKQIAALPN